MMKNRTAAAVVIAIVSIYSIFSASAGPCRAQIAELKQLLRKHPDQPRGRPTRTSADASIG
jgi:hypothetical protein